MILSLVVLLYRGESNSYQGGVSLNLKDEASRTYFKDLQLKVINTPLNDPSYKLFAASKLIDAGFEEGLTEAEKLYKVDPRSLDALALLSIANERLGNLSKAIEFRKAIAELDPWNAEYAAGKAYQLTHSLMAFGRGEWFGVGLGGSVEKLHYLPEAHTDFILAVIGEELGFVGVTLTIAIFYWIVRRAFLIGRTALQLDRSFAGLVAKGIAIWIGWQAFINMGVNLGILPTKGLTLPFVSFGGSGLLMNAIAMAVLLKVDFENRVMMKGGKV